MASRVLLAVCVGAAAAASCLAYATISRPYLAQRWHERLFETDTANEFQRNMRRILVQVDRQLGSGRVVFLGDSRIQQLDVAAIDGRAVNFGVGFDAVGTLTERLRDYQSLDGAAAIVLAVGINDMGKRGPEEIESGFRSVLGQLPAAVPLILSAILPVDERAMPAMRNADIRVVDDMLSRICDQRPRCVFVPPPTALLDGEGGLSAGAHIGDGLHLSAGANRTWGSQLRRAIGEVSHPR